MESAGKAILEAMAQAKGERAAEGGATVVAKKIAAAKVAPKKCAAAGAAKTNDFSQVRGRQVPIRLQVGQRCRFDCELQVQERQGQSRCRGQGEEMGCREEFLKLFACS